MNKQQDQLVVTKQYEKYAKEWRKAVRAREGLVIVFPYLEGRQIRMQQLVSEIEEKDKIPTLLFDPVLTYFDEFAELEQYVGAVLEKQEKKRLALVVPNGDSLMLPQNQKTLLMLQQLLTKYMNKVSTVVGMEKDFTQALPDYYRYNLVFQNISYFPLYSDSDVRMFVEYLARKWDLTISRGTVSEIIDLSGGTFWLAKEAVRRVREKGEWNPEGESLKERMKILARVFTEEEVRVLTSAVEHPRDEKFEKAAEYLAKIGFLTKDEKLRTQVLTPYLLSRIREMEELTMTGGEIKLRGISLEQVMSPTELALMELFMKNQQKALTREEIAQVLWPNEVEEKYSSWAIDQAVKRLRDRLVALSLPARMIRTVRGVGYEYRG
jgi:hypothetical protein